MTPEDRSRALKQEADEVLDLIGLEALVAPIGPLTPTGSYFMDLMMYPDIDMNLPLTTPEELMSIGGELSKQECVKKLRYLRGKDGPLKGGFYLKPEIDHGEWGACGRSISGLIPNRFLRNHALRWLISSVA